MFKLMKKALLILSLIVSVGFAADTSDKKVSSDSAKTQTVSEALKKAAETTPQKKPTHWAKIKDLFL